MSDTSGPAPPRSARIAGVAYLVTIGAGIFAEVYVRGSILVANDPTRTAAKLLNDVALFRWGILADCIMLGAYLVVTAMLYRLLKPVCAGASLVAAFFSLMGIALLVGSVISTVVIWWSLRWFVRREDKVALADGGLLPQPR